MLKTRQEKLGSVLCVGLDPEIEKFPKHLKESGRKTKEILFEWARAIIDATAPFVSTYKPQSAFWEALDARDIMDDVILYIKKNYSDIPVILDCKRGDIGNTMEKYRDAHFGVDGADAVNFSPYMGRECMEGLFDPNNPQRGIIALACNSNPSSRDIQELRLQTGEMLWEKIVSDVLAWSYDIGINENGGLVMGSAYMRDGEVYNFHLKRAREIVGDKLFFLTPGIGAQGGLLKETLLAGFSGWGSIAINSSRDINYAGDGEDFAEKAHASAEKLHMEMKQVLVEIVGK